MTSILAVATYVTLSVTGIGLLCIWGASLLSLVLVVRNWLAPSRPTRNDRLAPYLRDLLEPEIEAKYGKVGNDVGEVVTWSGKEFGRLRFG